MGATLCFFYGGFGYMTYMQIEEARLAEKDGNSVNVRKTKKDGELEWKSSPLKQWMMQPGVGEVVCAGISSVGVFVLIGSHIFSRRYVKSLKLTNQGKTLLIEDYRLLGPRTQRVPLASVYTTRLAWTGKGPTQTDSAIPDNVSTIQKAFRYWDEGFVPLHVEGRSKPMRVDRDGEFLNATVWDSLLYRKVENEGKGKVVKEKS
ncbi:hypothetical protein HDU76_003255 [Blyttiomyces sp. JEL0837]|nr:hypothetical protein HDU76_003255 [Blyttiomyces sp. JEL0837]